MRNWCIVDLLNSKEENYMLTDYGDLFSYSGFFQEKKWLTMLGRGKWREYVTMIKYDNRLIFPPYLTDRIAVYDLGRQELSYLPLPTENPGMKQYKKIARFGNKAYFIGDSVSTLICMNMESCDIKVCSGWQKEFQKQFGVQTRSNIYSDLCVTDHCFWIPLKEKNYVMEYNMENDTCSFHHVGEKEIQYASICFDGDCFWLSGDEEFLCKWNKEEDVIEYFEDFPADFSVDLVDDEKTPLFMGSIFWNESIYFIPMGANMSVRMDLRSGRMYPLWKCERRGSCRFMKETEDGSALYMEEVHGEKIKFSKSYKVEKSSLCKEISVLFTKGEEMQLLDGRFRLQSVTNEVSSQSLQNLTDILILNENEYHAGADQRMDGKNIYSIIGGSKR